METIQSTPASPSKVQEQTGYEQLHQGSCKWGVYKFPLIIPLCNMCIKEQFKVSGVSYLDDESINFLWLQVSLQWLERKLWEAEGESCKLLGSVNFNILSLMDPWFDNNLLVSHSCKILTHSIIKCVSQVLNLTDRAVESPEMLRLGWTRLPFLLQSICWSSGAARCGPVAAEFP